MSVAIKGTIIEAKPVEKLRHIGNTPGGDPIFVDQQSRYSITFRPDRDDAKYLTMDHDLVLEVDSSFTEGQKVTLTIA